MLLLEKQKIDSGYFLFEAEKKARENNEKRQFKFKQELCSEEIIEISRSGNTTVTDNEFV